MDSIKFVKFFNSLMKQESKKEDEYVDLNNYLFRWNYYLENIEIKIERDEFLSSDDVEELDKFLKTFFSDVRNNAKIQTYLQQKKREFDAFKTQIKKSNCEKLVECIEIKDDENIREIVNTESNDVSLNAFALDTPEPIISEEIIQSCLINVEEFLKVFVKEGESEKDFEEKIKELLLRIFSDNRPGSIKTFCTLFADNLVGMNSEKFETKLIILANVLSNLSSASSLITYSKLTIVLKHLFSNYLILINRSKTTNTVETFTLTKKMQTMCSNLYKSFPNQFTEACFIEWIKLLVIDCKMKSKTNIEFLLKLFKDLFNETEALILLKYFIRQHLDDPWNEDYYVFLNNIFDKIFNLNPTDLQLIVTKMKSDSKLFSKSLAFAKFLSTIINRLKLTSSIDDENFQQINENQYFESSKQDILYIIEQNQTLMKRKLLTMLN